MSRLLSNAAFLEQLEKARKEYARQIEQYSAQKSC